MIIDVIHNIDSRGQNPYIDETAIICRSSHYTGMLINTQDLQSNILRVLEGLDTTSLVSKNNKRLQNVYNKERPEMHPES